MKAEYTCEVQCRCPVDHRADFYTLTVRSRVTIPVEKILAACDALKAREVYQEDLTIELHRELGGEVETAGTHSGVWVRVTVGGSGC